jgi:acyl carrier protein
MARTLQVEPAGLSADAPLVGQLDSLTAVELKTRIEFDLGVEVPVAVFFDGNSADVLASLLLEQLSAVEADGEESEVAELLASLEGMSEEEARGLLVSAEETRADEGADA